MPQPIRLIAGLGNPGDPYLDTRHNAGFDFVDALAHQCAAQWQPDKRSRGLTCEVLVGPHKVTLLKPQMFMNRSGQSVAALANFFKWSPDQILVAHDELDLPAGTARFKRGGGHGGHNGLRDILAHLGKAPFYRLRLGIGHPGSAREVTNYVLSRAPRSEQDALDSAIDRALENLPLAVSGEWEKAMHALHTPRG